MRHTLQSERVNRLAEEALFAVGEQRALLKKNLRLVRGIGKEFELALSDLDVIARSVAIDAKAAGFTYGRPEQALPRPAHQHSCGHDCICGMTPLATPNCVDCRHEAFATYRASLA